jgi:hypothetical protein
MSANNPDAPRLFVSRYFDVAGAADAELGGATFAVSSRTFQPSLSCSKTILLARRQIPLGSCRNSQPVQRDNLAPRQPIGETSAHA